MFTAMMLIAASLMAGRPAADMVPLERCVPADAMAVYINRPAPRPEHDAELPATDRLGGLLMTLKLAGVLPREGRIIADIAGTLPVVGRHPHALVLLDITAQRVGRDSYRLDELQAGLVVQSGGMTPALDRRIRDLLRTYTDAGHAAIETVEENGVRRHRLIDERLPAWSVIEWGEVGPHVVIGMGQDAFSTLADVIRERHPPLAEAPWYVAARRRLGEPRSGIEVVIDLVRIRERVGEVVRRRADDVIRALELDEVTHLVWQTGFEGRALRSEVVARSEGPIVHHLRLAGPGVAAECVEAVLPADAGSYAALRFSLADIFHTAREAWLEGQSPQRQERFRDGWQQLETAFDFDAETGLVDRLGEHLVIHDYPRHPLRLPMFFTLWIEHTGDAATVAGTIDAMMSAWKSLLGAPAGTQPAIGLRPRVQRTETGIWFLQLGIMGPALGVADDWIVISFSPEAVRANLDYLESRH